MKLKKIGPRDASLNPLLNLNNLTEKVKMRLLVLMLTPLLSVQSEKTGNNVVKCAAYRTVEQRVESWECKVNCEVIQGSQGKGLE